MDSGVLGSVNAIEESRKMDLRPALETVQDAVLYVCPRYYGMAMKALGNYYPQFLQ